MRAVAVLVGDSPEEVCADARRALAKGVRVFWLPSDTMPGGVSPAAKALDPLWDMLSEADAPALSHTGSDEKFYATLGWRQAEPF